MLCTGVGKDYATIRRGGVGEIGMTEDRSLPARLAQRGIVLVRDHWRWVVVFAWLGLSGWFIYRGWNQILSFGLGDTDDNMRMSQVRALLAGQDWFDLRNYKMMPPVGENMHWSRLVDLPIAGLILLFRPIVGGANAERIAAAVAPLLPMLPMMWALALSTRRLIDPRAYPLALCALFFAGSTLGMYGPMRIDHHGWQLALLAIGAAALADPKRARGGATLGLASALSLTIGLEMLIYIAIAGVTMVLLWVDDRGQHRRLIAYAATLAGGCALGFAGFASYANRAPVCDALSPVWLSNALLGGALLAGLAMLRVEKWTNRLLLAAAAGAILAGFHALTWPHCLSRLEGVSPEVAKLWLSNVREARPIWKHGWQVALLVIALPVAGVIGYVLLGWSARHDRTRLRPIIAVGLTGLTALALLAWQTRTGPASQLLGIPGAVAIAWLLAPRTFSASSSVVRVLGTTGIVLFGLGGLVPMLINFVPGKPSKPIEKKIGRANARCPTLTAMKPVAKQPAGIVFTFVDLAPRLITVTHHSSITGPYHRNGEAIGDVMRAFRGTADQAQATIRKYRSDYVLICPLMSQTTIWMVEAPKGFYVQLARGQVPTWLKPIPLGKDSPLRLYRVVG